jgi:hypothetical protein
MAQMASNTSSLIDTWTTTPAALQFPVLNEISIPEQSGDLNGIIALKNYGPDDELAIFREGDAWTLLGVGSDDYTLAKVNGEGGCVSVRGIADVGGSLIVIGNGQIYEFSNGTMQPIGDKIRPLIKGVNLSTASAEYMKDENVVLISTSEGTFVWNVANREWEGAPKNAFTKWTICPKGMCQCKAPTDNGQFLMGFSGSAYVYEYGGQTDDGTTINFKYRTKLFDFDTFAEVKQLRSMKALTTARTLTPFVARLILNDGEKIESQTVTVRFIGGIWGTDVWGSFVWGGGDAVVADIPISDDLLCNFFAVEVESTDVYDLTLYKIAVEYFFENRRREEA